MCCSWSAQIFKHSFLLCTVFSTDKGKLTSFFYKDKFWYWLLPPAFQSALWEVITCWLDIQSIADGILPTGSQKGWSWLAELVLLHWDAVFWEVFFANFLFKPVYLSLHECQDFIMHMKKSANCSLCTQPILCPILKSLIILALDILLRTSRSFVSSFSHNLSWSMLCASVACNPHSFFRILFLERD